jgi:hypothetical protein
VERGVKKLATTETNALADGAIRCGGIKALLEGNMTSRKSSADSFMLNLHLQYASCKLSIAISGAA